MVSTRSRNRRRKGVKGWSLVNLERTPWRQLNVNGTIFSLVQLSAAWSLSAFWPVWLFLVTPVLTIKCLSLVQKMEELRGILPSFKWSHVAPLSKHTQAQTHTLTADSIYIYSHHIPELHSSVGIQSWTQVVWARLSQNVETLKRQLAPCLVFVRMSWSRHLSNQASFFFFLNLSNIEGQPCYIITVCWCLCEIKI